MSVKKINDIIFRILSEEGFKVVVIDDRERHKLDNDSFQISMIASNKSESKTRLLIVTVEKKE